MPAAMAPSPSPSLSSTPARSVDAAVLDGASSSRHHDPSTTADVGSASTPIDLAASPPPSAQASSSSARTDLPPPPSLGRVLPPAPIQPDRSTSPAKQVRLPTPYKAPRLPQTGASESFATAYPTQETRQKYASPAKPLLSTTGTPAKRTWQTAVDGQNAVDGANKKAKATSVEPSAASDAPSGSNVTITGIPKPGSTLSNQVSPPDLQPSVSGTEMTAEVKTEYLSLLDKPELIDMVKQLESQLLELLSAPIGSSTLYRQARIYPANINVQIEKLKARQRAEAAKQQLLAQKAPLSAANLSLADVYSLLNSKIGAAGAARSLNSPLAGKGTGRPIPMPRRPVGPPVPGSASPSKSAAATSKSQSLNSLISSINALVGQQSQTARGPTGTPLPPRSPSKPTASPASSLISPAMLKSIVGDGPMPSNAALAAAITAHFGGNLPGRTSASPAASSTVNGGTSPSPASLAQGSRTEGPGKDISAKIAAILGSSSSAQTPMLGPQGLPLAPAAGAGDNMQIGNIAAMLSSLSAPKAGGSGDADRSNAALATMLKQLEEARKAGETATPNNTAVQDPVAILTGASANPLFTPTYPDFYEDQSSSPEPEPVIVQGPLGTSTLPSYEDMIVEGLREKGESPPRMLFEWMQQTYPLMKNFRPSASQALQKAFKRGRLLKTGTVYQINPAWTGAREGRKPTRRPQVGKDHPMITAGPSGGVLAVSPQKDSQAYRNVAEFRPATPAKGGRPGPRPYGQPGADPLPNPASSIFQSGSAASVILEYKKHTGQELDADSIKKLYQLIRASPSNATGDQILVNLLNETGYAAAAAAVTAANESRAQPSAAPSHRPVGQRLPAPMSNVARGPTSLPLPTSGEPTMMQQLARMLNDLSSPIDPALANSLLGQLSSNAAASAAQANAQRAAPGGASSSEMLASALSAVSGQQPQQDLDSAVSETLAAALQQIGATGGSQPPASAAEPTSKAAESAPATTETGEGIDLTDYQDAIRALTSAFGSGEQEGDDNDESDEEADERAIAAAEADLVLDPSVAASSDAAQAAHASKAATEEHEADAAKDAGAESENAQMDLSAVLRQLTDSLQPGEAVDPDAGAEETAQEDTQPGESGDKDAAPADDAANTNTDEANLQSQLEALVASLAANASDDDDDDDDDDSDEDEAAS